MLTHNLRIFLEVANRRSITETANARYISQPAVSKAIQSLEKELSLKLFHRDKKNGMIPTEAGEKILLLARQMEDLENRIRQMAFRENNFIGGKLRIASVPVTTTVLLSKVLRQAAAISGDLSLCNGGNQGGQSPCRAKDGRGTRR